MARRTALVAFGVALTALAGCATPHRHDDHGHGHDAASTNRMSDRMSDMCAAYRETMAGKSPAEQQAAAEAHVEAMHGRPDPQHAARHLEMMQRRCAERP